MKTQIILKTDKDIKDKAQRISKNLGLPLSTVINAYLREFVRDREVKFSMEPQLRPEIGKLLEQASADYKANRNISPVFSTAEEMDVYLDSL